VTDYGHDLEFGVFLTPEAEHVDRLLELTQLAEVLGLDVVSLQDHPYQAKYVDTWTMLSVLGARTSTITLAPNVASLPLRPPVVLAKSAATLDRVTGGRVALGLGAGAFWDAIVAAGGERRTAGEAVDALVEAIGLIREFWAGGTVRFEGEHYRAKGLHAGPVPAHPIPIWLGSYGPRMLRVTGRLADGWVPSMGYADPPVLPEMNARLDEAAVAAGRTPHQIRRIYNVFGRFGTGAGFLQGTPADWAEQLAGLTLDQGFATYILGTDDADTLRRFAEEVVPAVRAQVTAGRGAGQASAATGESGRGGQPTGTGQWSAVSAGLTRVSATPDDGHRRSDRMPWDETTRPTLGEPADASYPPAQAAAAQHLVEIHDALRAELTQLRDVVAQVRRGHLTVGAARSVVNTMALRQNNWTLGAFCESYCRIVTGHHTLEDRSVFPHLRRSEAALGPVLDRLEEEHHVIHDVLDQVDRALVDLVREDGSGEAGRARLAELQTAIDLLTDTLLSHLAYEERALIGPLARHGLV
jgi:alkanesulfonate monooxygenase SsuD/methylene tetrahydromethanopterin reductase-like flavin-dependent oxidoreductase (luciferase family)